MAQIIHFRCRGCELDLETPPSGAETAACSGCGRAGGLHPTPLVLEGRLVDACAQCGHADLYVQKDFNRILGLAIVGVGVAASLVFFARGEPLLAMAALGATAVIDAVIYWLVPEVAVCYSCHAIYRGFPRNPEHLGFNLELLERFGGRDPRR